MTDDRRLMLRNTLSLCLIVVATSAIAAGESIVSDKTYACMSVAPATGVTWNAGRWEPQRYGLLEKFLLNVLVIQDASKQQYLHFNIKGDGKEDHCGAIKEPFSLTGLSCMQHGRSILFSEETMKGGISYLLGATSTDTKRDALAVMPFTCQNF